MHKPYIGVTGIVVPQERRALIRAFGGEACSHEFMAGVLVSSKTLAGGTNKYPNRYPRIERVREIFNDEQMGVFNCIHYHPADRMPLDEQLESLVEACGCVQGFQINAPWPNAEELGEFRQHTQHRYRIILQLGAEALEGAGDNPTVVANWLRIYVTCIDDVLIDCSAGKGVPLNPVRAHAYLSAIAEQHPHLGIGVAGALSAKTLSVVDPLLAAHPNMSLDAESGVRVPGVDDLDLAAAVAYLDRAKGLVDMHEHSRTEILHLRCAAG